jgi:hypothetical protein
VFFVVVVGGVVGLGVCRLGVCRCAFVMSISPEMDVGRFACLRSALLVLLTVVAALSVSCLVLLEFGFVAHGVVVFSGASCV